MGHSQGQGGRSSQPGGWEASCGRGSPTGGREGNTYRILTGASGLCPSHRPPEEEVQVLLVQDLVLEEQKWAGLSCMWLALGPDLSQEEAGATAPEGMLGVPGPTPPTLGPCNLNKDIDPPSFAYVYHCAGAGCLCTSPECVPGALGGHSFSVLAASLSPS